MVGRIADLPFRPAPPDDLLGIDWGRPGFVDEDHVGFGWGLVPRLELVGTADGPEDGERLLEGALVLALHSADREATATAPFDLELVVDGERLHVPLDRFLEVWLPSLPATNDLVLAVCNPTDFPLGPPSSPRVKRCWVPLGDVDSSARFDPLTRETTWVLRARSWFNP